MTLLEGDCTDPFMKVQTTTDPITEYLETQPLNRMRLHFYKVLGIQPCTDPKWHTYEEPDQQ